MKLLQKYSRINVAVSVVIFVLASIAFYFLLHFIFIKQLDDDLGVELNEISTYVTRNNALPEVVLSGDEITSYKTVSEFSPKKYVRTIKMTEDGESENYRQLEFGITAAGKNYRVYVSKSLENTDHIIRSVILVSAITILLLLAASFIVNRIVLRRLWKPFYNTMRTMKQYRIGQKDFPEFEKTSTEEFTALNETLNSTIKQAEAEYNTLKEFTENASHEMQTPVAVIRSKMDVLIQDEHLSEPQSRIVQEAYTAIQKLTRLNQALLLLTKIENRQFADKEQIDLQNVLNEKLSFFHEILSDKTLTVEVNSEAVSVKMNPALADILLNNLFSNCIRHSNPAEKIIVALSKKQLAFCNGPAEKGLNDKQIFTRFYKGGNTGESHGLGLAIVKEICTVSGFAIEYRFENGMHCFVVGF